jgi:hypothetical protein
MQPGGQAYSLQLGGMGCDGRERGLFGLWRIHLGGFNQVALKRNRNEALMKMEDEESGLPRQ